MSTSSIDYPTQKTPLQTALFGDFLANLCEIERRCILLINDVVVLSEACLFSFALFGGRGERLILAWLAVTIAALYASDQYSLEPHRDRTLCRGVFFGGGLTLIFALLTRAPLMTFSSLLLAGLLASLVLVFSRRVWHSLLSRAARRLLLLCEEPEAVEAGEEISRHSLAGLQPSTTSFKAIRTEDFCNSESNELLSLPQLFERLSRRIPIRMVDERWFIENFSWSRSWSYRLLKRCFDVFFATTGLLLALPLFPLIAILIRLDGPGPVFYSQPRVGFQGRVFKLYKFRTMRLDAEKSGAVWAKENDDRITRIGRFLRRSRLDEIPQLFQVLSGRMSLVGPRPERPEFMAEIEKAIPYYQYRHLVLPGITGWAQVRFPYGASLRDSEEKLKYDLYYLKFRSLLFDFLILLRTVFVVLNKQGSR